MHQYKKLGFWQRSVDLATEIYEITSGFPGEEKYGLISQLRRCAVSINSNIAEGGGRNSNGDFNRFLGIDYGSLCELETQLIIAEKLQFCESPESERLISEVDELQKMVFTFSNNLSD